VAHQNVAASGVARISVISYQRNCSEEIINHRILITRIASSQQRREKRGKRHQNHASLLRALKRAAAIVRAATLRRGKRRGNSSGIKYQHGMASATAGVSGIISV